MHCIVIFGNSGSGKTTLARELSSRLSVPHLDLDQLAWESPGVRRAFHESAAEIAAFVQAHDGWVIEGCYGDLIELAVPHAREVRFLDPGVDACIANCRARPWEPDKYPTPEAQNAMLDFLLDWVRSYYTRTDEYSHARHQRIFDEFERSRAEDG